MLWKVGDGTLHILGSIHVAEAPLLSQADTDRLLDCVELVTFEANFEAPNVQDITRYKKPGRLQKNVPSALFEETRQVWLNQAKQESELEALKPWAAALAIQNTVMANSGLVRALGVDHLVLQAAKEARKRLFYLETRNAGLAPFANAPLQEQVVLLDNAVRKSEEGLKEVRAMIAAWQARDPVLLSPFVDRALAVMPKTFSAVLAGRNKLWLPHLIRQIKSGKRAVVVIGMLHMAGPDSVPDLLRTAGHSCDFVDA